jgi:hypothetical protein
VFGVALFERSKAFTCSATLVPMWKAHYGIQDSLLGPLGLLMAACGLLLLIVCAGLFGNQSTFKNIAPVAVWVVWWVGLSFVCAFIAFLVATIFAAIVQPRNLWAVFVAVLAQCSRRRSVFRLTFHSPLGLLMCFRSIRSFIGHLRSAGSKPHPEKAFFW